VPDFIHALIKSVVRLAYRTGASTLLKGMLTGPLIKLHVRTLFKHEHMDSRLK